MSRAAPIIGDSLQAAAYGPAVGPYTTVDEDAPTLIFMACTIGRHVGLEFGCAVKWLAMEPAEAIRLAHLLVENACHARAMEWPEREGDL